MEEYGRDIAVIDIRDVVNFLGAELTSVELRRAVNRTFDFLTNPRLCGKHEYVNSFREAVDEWLDEMGEESE